MVLRTNLDGGHVGGGRIPKVLLRAAKQCVRPSQHRGVGAVDGLDHLRAVRGGEGPPAHTVRAYKAAPQMDGWRK